MSRRPRRSDPVVALHGLGGPGPEHWYSWLAGELDGLWPAMWDWCGRDSLVFF